MQVDASRLPANQALSSGLAALLSGKAVLSEALVGFASIEAANKIADKSYAKAAVLTILSLFILKNLNQGGSMPFTNMQNQAQMPNMQNPLQAQHAAAIAALQAQIAQLQAQVNATNAANSANAANNANAANAANNANAANAAANPWAAAPKPSAFSSLNNSINSTLMALPFGPKTPQGANLLKGVLLGAGAAYVLGNKDCQDKIFTMLLKAKELLDGSLEEMKERYEDNKARLEG